MFICSPPAAFCCLPCQWPLSAKPGRSFLSPFPPSQARFLSEPALHVRGYSPCRKGRRAAPRLFLFLWRLWPGAARCWPGLEGPSPGGGSGQCSVSPLLPAPPNETSFQKRIPLCRSCPGPGPSREGTLWDACFPVFFPELRAHRQPETDVQGPPLRSEKANVCPNSPAS